MPRGSDRARGPERDRDRGATEIEAKVVLVGEAAVGKTSLVRRYVSDDFREDYLMTLGVVLSKRSEDVVLGDASSRVTMVLWDTMGEHALADTLRETYLRDARGVVLVCDGSDPRTTSGLRSWIEAARRAGRDPAVAILENKSDLGVSPEAREAVLREGLLGWTPCYSTSAKTGQNVPDAFRDVAMRIATRALGNEGDSLDLISLGIVIDASVRPRTLTELAQSIQLPRGVVLARADDLVRRGYLRVVQMSFAAEGLPDPTFTATGKSFPRTGRVRVDVAGPTFPLLRPPNRP